MIHTKKNTKYLIAFLLLATAACDSDIVDRLDDLSGTWKLTEMTYTDPEGMSQTVLDSKTTLLFTKEIAGGGSANVDGVRYGIQDTGNEEYRFQYSIDFSTGYIDILYYEDGDIPGALPLDAVGRVQVYRFEQRGNSRIIIAVEQEEAARGDFETLKNVRYVFERE